jgi:hypothetical protein
MASDTDDDTLSSRDEDNENEEVPEPKHELIPSVWVDLKDRLELMSRAFFLRYPKLTREEIDLLIRKLHSNGKPLSRADIYYLHCRNKLSSNLSTWKNASTQAMRVSFLFSILTLPTNSPSRNTSCRVVSDMEDCSGR